MDFNTMYQMLVDYEIATRDEIDLVCTINGSDCRTLEDILFAREGYRDFEIWEKDNTIQEH